MAPAVVDDDLYCPDLEVGGVEVVEVIEGVVEVIGVVEVVAGATAIEPGRQRRSKSAGGVIGATWKSKSTGRAARPSPECSVNVCPSGEATGGVVGAKFTPTSSSSSSTVRASQ